MKVVFDLDGTIADVRHRVHFVRNGNRDYRTPEDWAMVRYDKHDAPIDRATYEANGYSPPFDKLPTEAEYKAKNPGPKDA